MIAWTLLPWGNMSNQVIAEEVSPIPENLPIAVSVIRMQEQDEYLTYTTYTGMVQAERRTQLAFELPGTITSIEIKNGDLVNQGQIIATLDTQTLDAQRNSLKANLKAAQARLEELINGPRKQQIDMARQELNIAKVRQAQAQKRFDQQDALNRKNAGNQFKTDMEALELEALKAHVEMSKAKLDELEEGTRHEMINFQRAEILRIKASLEENQTHLNKATIKAPFAGRVSSREVYKGASVQPGQTIITLTDETNMRVEVGLPQNVIDTLAENSALELSIGNHIMNISYTSILPELSPQTRTARMVFDFENPGIRAIVGRIATLRVPDIDQRQGYVVPVQSLRPDTHGLWFVTVAKKNDSNQWTAEKRYVQPLVITGDQAYIQGPFSVDDLLITDGSHRFAAGQIIQPITKADAESIDNDNKKDKG